MLDKNQTSQTEDVRGHCCYYVPPHILEAITQSDAIEEEGRDCASRTAELSRTHRESRSSALSDAHQQGQANGGVSTGDQTIMSSAGASSVRRHIYDCRNSANLPGTTVRREGERRSKDRSVNNAYDGFGLTHDFFYNVFGRHSIDGQGGEIIGSVHYDKDFDNAFWNGRQMVFGDGDGLVFDDFTDTLEVIAHELTHGVTQYTAGLRYKGQSGALNEHVSDAFGSMVEQWHFGQMSKDADWILGQGLLSMLRRGPALRSLKAPGTAYNDSVLGKDPQPGHMRDYIDTTQDNGGVHLNSGIPNHAFYLVATRLGGYSWDKPGKIWYATITDAHMTPDCTFEQFAKLTVDNAHKLYDPLTSMTVRQAWIDVGVLNPSSLKRQEKMKALGKLKD